MTLKNFLNVVTKEQDFARSCVHHRNLPAESARYLTTTSPLLESVVKGLDGIGIPALFSHQAEAIDAIRNGENVVAVTPTASGKSLLYNIPVIETLASTPDSHALYLFPLKALEQDQLAKINELCRASGIDDKVSALIYDGDTPSHIRMKIRKTPPRILITNPDMLNLSILGYHSSWEDFLRGLKFIVIDELHIYRGIFGSHFLHVLHRLLRLCHFYGSFPQVIATSATIAGAKELAEELTGQPFTEISRYGSPSSERHFLFYNPEISYLTFTQQLFVAALQNGLKTIVFTKSRRVTELLHMWLNRHNRTLARKISSYRAGFLPEERREIESGLSSGKLQGVISTSALELGIDIGGLDVCIMAGYPGTIAATWQRAGRVGRAKSPAAVCLVAGQDQLDQFFMRHPSDFFRRSAERAIVDSNNSYIVKPHIVCAAQEIPITSGDYYGDQEHYSTVLTDLTQHGQLLVGATGDRWFSSRRRPQRNTNLRSAGDQYIIEIENTNRDLGSVNGRAVLAECHPGAIYLHRGEQYLVTNLDTKAKKATVQHTEVNYFTTPLFEKDTEILEEISSKPTPAGKVTLAKLKVTEQIVGFQKRRMATQDLISQHELEYPPSSYDTVGLVIAIPQEIAEKAAEQEMHFRAGIHGVEHSLLALAPLFALCDRNDMGGYSQIDHPQVGSPCVFLYDGYPGGIGLAQRLYEVFDQLAFKTHALVSECPCEIGCPSCIHSPKCGHGNVPLDKDAAVFALEYLSGMRNLEQLLKDKPLKPTLKKITVATPDQPTQPEPTLPDPEIPANWDMSKTAVIFDVETQRSADEVGGWSNIKAMGLAWAVAYQIPERKYYDFPEDKVDDLIKLLQSADVVVGFNQIRFDYDVLRAYSGVDFRKFNSYDILVEISNVLNHRLSLNAVASATLGAVKSADGLQSLEWWRNGEVEKVAKYCRKDVAITRDVFYHILEKRYLLFEKKGIGLVRVPLEFKWGK